MNDTTQWFSGKRKHLLLFSGTVEIILTQDTQIYFKNFLGMTISPTAIYGTKQQACQCCLPRIPLCRIASINYTLHPTTFYQSGVYQYIVLYIVKIVRHWLFETANVTLYRIPLSPFSLKLLGGCYSEQRLLQ